MYVVATSSAVCLSQSAAWLPMISSPPSSNAFLAPSALSSEDWFPDFPSMIATCAPSSTLSTINCPPLLPTATLSVATYATQAPPWFSSSFSSNFSSTSTIVIPFSVASAIPGSTFTEERGAIAIPLYPLEIQLSRLPAVLQDLPRSVQHRGQL